MAVIKMYLDIPRRKLLLLQSKGHFLLEKKSVSINGNVLKNSFFSQLQLWKHYSKTS